MNPGTSSAPYAIVRAWRSWAAHALLLERPARYDNLLVPSNRRAGTDRMWHERRLPPPLEERTAHVWLVHLDVKPDHVQQLHQMLTDDERARANAFHFPHLRRRYVAAHAALRQLLARYLAATPSSLRFRDGPNGKPFLVGVPGRPNVSFNLTHSEEIALIAVTPGRDVGVDVEWVRPFDDADEIAEHYFCPPERDALRASEGDVKIGLFFTYWTRKEALLKATGDGLSLPLNQVDVSTVPGDRPQSVPVLDGSGVLRHLALVDLHPPAGYAGALAVDGDDWQWSCWRWPL